ncbi:MAG: endonuclease III domain-containing protein [bacterium]
MKPIQVYNKLFDHFGPQNWWPADSAFEVIVGAILTQNTNWVNVEKAIEALKKDNLLSPEAISKVPLQKLEKAIRSSGFYRQKARRLKYFTSYLKKNYNLNMKTFICTGKEKLRKELLSLSGIGPETADSIILYAAGKPSFVIDAYTKRMCKRIGATNISDYEPLKGFFESSLPRNVKLYNEFHALIVVFVKNYCRVKPLCGKCPLKGGCRYMRGLGNRQNKTFQIKKAAKKPSIPKIRKKKK